MTVTDGPDYAPGRTADQTDWRSQADFDSERYLPAQAEIPLSMRISFATTDGTPSCPPDCAAPTNAPSTPESEHPVIFFDGICGLCNRTVDFVIARDRSRLFRFAPLQGETAQRLLGIAPDQPLNSLVLIDGEGIHHRTDAVWRMLVGLGGIWRFAGRLLRVVPRPVRNAMYNLIAQNRYRWFGRKESCRLPAPEERALFLP